MTDLHVTRLGSGPPLVLVHGSFSWGLQTWSRQRPLAERYQLLIVDRRGFGDSPPVARVDFERDAQDLAELLEETGPAHLVGHSYGGIIVMLAAARTPRTARSLAVIEPPLLGLVRGDPDAEAFIERISRVFTQPDLPPTEVLRGFVASFGQRLPEAFELTEPMARAVATSLTEREPWEAEIPFEALAAAPFAKLVIRGGWPGSSPEVVSARRLFAAISATLAQRSLAELLVFPEAGHLVQALGEPFNARLEAFLDAAP